MLRLLHCAFLMPDQVSVRAECIGSFLNADNGGLWMPRVWDKPNYNFDGFGKVG